MPEEFRVEYVADRAETTSTVWLGLTVGCARCHDHKYDPIKQKDFYRFFAYFNNVPEKGLVYNFGNEEPLHQSAHAGAAEAAGGLGRKVVTARAELASLRRQSSRQTQAQMGQNEGKRRTGGLDHQRGSGVPAELAGSDSKGGRL